MPNHIPTLRAAQPGDRLHGFVLSRKERLAARAADAYLLPGRSDVQCEGRTNLSDIPQLPTDWDKMMETASDTAAKLNSLCK